MLDLVLDPIHPRTAHRIAVRQHLGARSVVGDEVPHPVGGAGLGVGYPWEFYAQGSGGRGMGFGWGSAVVADVAV